MGERKRQRLPDLNDRHSREDRDDDLDCRESDREDELNLMDACIGGDFVTAERLLLEEATDPDCDPQENSWRPLHRTAHAGNLAMVSLLVESGADLSLLTNEGMDPLMIACHRGEMEVGKFLIECGADLTTKDKAGRTAISHYGMLSDPAITPQEKREQVAQLMEVFRLTSSECASGELGNAIDDGDVEGAIDLLDEGADLEHDEDHDGNLPLHRAVSSGLQELVVLFCQRGANVESKMKDGTTPLLLAALLGDMEICLYLLSEGGNMYISNRQGHTVIKDFNRNSVGRPMDRQMQVHNVQILVAAHALYNETMQLNPAHLPSSS